MSSSVLFFLSSVSYQLVHQKVPLDHLLTYLHKFKCTIKNVVTEACVCFS
uniref:Uncharacterized protein n=1 Tax=Anguilla anguilla TaxID=7936 RepID=A0A0E9S573_ANGAN